MLKLSQNIFDGLEKNRELEAQWRLRDGIEHPKHLCSLNQEIHRQAGSDWACQKMNKYNQNTKPYLCKI